MPLQNKAELQKIKVNTAAQTEVHTCNIQLAVQHVTIITTRKQSREICRLTYPISIVSLHNSILHIV